MQDRKRIKINITPRAKAAIEAIAARDDMTELGVASRVYEWFAAQDEVIQRAVLGQIPPSIAPDVAQAILKKMKQKD